jgi:hypothetical protein
MTDLDGLAAVRSSSGVTMSKFSRFLAPVLLGGLVLSFDPRPAVGQEQSVLQKMREAAARQTTMNNLKQIGLAIHNYHDVHGHYPPAAVVDKKGKKLLSWRVMILPYIEEERLYKQFKLDEPWDSEHNKKLIPQMPKTYADARGKIEAGRTHVKVFVGQDAGFDWVRARKFADITDGMSNTILAAVAGESVVWTKPDDFEFDAENAVPDLKKPFANVLVLMFDGSVRVLNPKNSEETLKRVIQRNDGQPIADDF